MCVTLYEGSRQGVSVGLLYAFLSLTRKTILPERLQLEWSVHIVQGVSRRADLGLCDPVEVETITVRWEVN